MAYFRPTQSDDVDFDQFTGATKRSMDYIKERGINHLQLSDLRRLGNSLIRTAKVRIRELEKAGYTDLPAYRYYKNEIKNFTLSQTSLNQARHMVMETYQFLLSKTSTVSGSKEFLQSTIDKWVGRGTTREQREALFDLFHRIEKKHPNFFLSSTYSSAEMSDDIFTFAEVLRAKDWDIDRAMQVLEREVGTSLIFDDDLDEDLMDEVVDWFIRKEGGTE